MQAVNKCQGKADTITGKPRQVCAQCYRLTAPGLNDPERDLEPKAHRTTGQRWVCINRIEKVAA